MVTIAGRLNKSLFGKIPIGLRWILAIGIVIAITVVVIKFTVASSADTTAQAPIAAAPAVAPLAQQVSTAQTLQLTPAEQQTLYLQLAGAGSEGPYRTTKQTAEQLSQLHSELRAKALTGEIKAIPFGPITQEPNGTASVNVRVKASDYVQGKKGEAIWATVAQKDITLYFTLDAKKELKEVTGMRRLN